MSQTFHLIEYLTVNRDRGILIWILNIGAEKYWNRVHAGIVDRSEEMTVNRVEEMNLLLCREQDVLILRERPSESYLAHLKRLGFATPTILVPEETDPLTPISELVLKDEQLQKTLSNIAKDADDVYFVPYAVTHLEESIANNCGLQLVGAPSGVNAVVNDKIFNRHIAEQLGLDVCQGKVCHSVQEIRDEYERLTNGEQRFEKIIIKEPHGASGKGLYIIESPEKLSAILARLARVARSHEDAKWLVEGWYLKKADVNYQIYVAPNGEVDVFSIKQQVLRDTVYIGSKAPAELDEVVLEAYHDFGKRIGNYLYSIGYSGVAGIDSIITDDDLIIPIIEINGRFTLSTYISFIGHVLGEQRLYSRYFKLVSDSPCDYDELQRVLQQENILYNQATGEGVLVYTSATLPLRLDASSGSYTGRLFTLILARDWEGVEAYNERLEHVVQHFASLRLPASSR
ncbi:ATP-grasp domain-containing protein [Paenibacillus sp. SYP-B3998]|uniref:ATP-grasp domain-containing protein n=1 Tax=Paenibacillus sp. SYP-B3998 TaxID=2678564 RepID=A0A6G3ZVM3_9BACL|nr:peptide ligase PGM1-related protein [Paenibacillus sp. SYP-B3998]NEW06263.1 ATP-grasp domain-containing protein [Paenibacillus sp. SYP-B3998]